MASEPRSCIEIRVDIRMLEAGPMEDAERVEVGGVHA